MNNFRGKYEFSVCVLSTFRFAGVWPAVLGGLFMLCVSTSFAAKVSPAPSPAVSLLRPVMNNETQTVNKPSVKADTNNAAQTPDMDKKGLIFFPMEIHYSQQENTGGVVVNVVNPGPSTYLLQGTVSAFDPDTGRSAENSATPVPPFVILPPLHRLDGEGRSALRIRQVGGQLPADRETAIIVSVRAIPASEMSNDKEAQTAGSRVLIALRMNMRLFWRPSGVPAADKKKIAASLTFVRQGQELVVTNPTPWFVQFGALSAAGVAVPEVSRRAWVSPKSSHTFRFNRPVAGPLTWTLSGDKNEHQTSL